MQQVTSMPSRLGKRKDYNLVDDVYDSRVPMHNEDAFRHGIEFKAKYIGTLDVPRPTGRMEIVVAMRRIRYEFKAKAIKKRKVNIRVSTDGVRVVLRKRKKKKEWAWDLDRMLIMHDPIYRIFYVSHDSHDLKIWSFIARDGQSNVFRCNVFKSPKKSQAMRVVRTVGQAFEVCHKLNIGPPPKKDENSNNKIKEIKSGDDDKDKSPSEETEASNQDKTLETITENSTSPNEDLDTKKSLPSDGKPPIVTKDAANPLLQSTSEPISLLQSIDSKTPLSMHHQLQLNQHKVQQAEHQAEVAVAQVHLLKDQLLAETSARLEAQARNHQLLLQNRELLQQMSELVAKLAEVEAKLNNVENDDSFALGLSKIIVDATTPTSGNVNLPAMSGANMTKASPFIDNSLFENANTSMRTPDLSKHSNGLLATTDTSTSTITKSSTASDSVRLKTKHKQRKMNGDAGFGSSSSSSSDEDDDEGIHPIIHLANESGTLRNNQMEKSIASMANGSTVADQTENTSIWTSGLVTPERILSGQGYQHQEQSNCMSFDDVSLSTTVNESNASNGYTLSPIFTVGSATAEAHSSFQHFSITDADTSLKLDETPKSTIKYSQMKKSYSTSADMHEREKQMPPSSHSSAELNSQPRKSSRSFIKWTKVSERESPIEESLLSQLPDSSNQSPDLTPRLDPPPRVKRPTSSRALPDYRPRPEMQPSDVTISPSHSSTGTIVSPKLVDTSDSDLEVPSKLAKYHSQGVKLSQSTYSYGSDPLLSRFDPLLSKSKSFNIQSSESVPKVSTESFTTVLSPVQDVGQNNPFLYITPQTPESSKYCKSVNPEELSRSYSDLEQPSTMYVTGIFSSPEEYESKLRYEPLRKQQASEWHRPSDTTESRLNSSFHAGDQNNDQLHKTHARDDTRGPLPVYRTYSDLTSTVTPIKTSSGKSNQNANIKTLGSYNSNTNNNIPSIGDKTSGMKNLIPLKGDTKSSSIKEPPSVDGNISLLDDLFISESDNKILDESLSLSPLNATNLNIDRVLSHVTTQSEVSVVDKISVSNSSSLMTTMHGNQHKTLETLHEEFSKTDVSIESSRSQNDVVSAGDINLISTTSANSDSGVSGCGGMLKTERETMDSLEVSDH